MASRLTIYKSKVLHAESFAICSSSKGRLAHAHAHPRTYATQTSLGTSSTPPPRHKKVTAFNDNGQVPWGQLSAGEKVARTTQQSFNATIIVGGALLTIAVFTLLYTDVFSPQSTTNHFNRAVNRIKSDQRCTDVLGKSSEITAFGEASWNKWRRNRPIASRIETDKLGTERLYMHFNVAGPLNEGVVNLFMVRRKDESEFNYGYLALDVPGQSRIYLENADERKNAAKVPGRFFGLKWS